MAEKLYYCQVIGTGTREDPFRPAAADIGGTYRAAIKVNPDGTLARNWCLALVFHADHVPHDADPRLVSLTTAAFDDSLDASIDTAELTRLRSQLNLRLGVQFGELEDFEGHKRRTLRQMVRRHGKILEPAFDEVLFEPRRGR